MYCDKYVCVCICVFVCPRGYLQNYMRDLYQISVPVAYGHGLVLLRQTLDCKRWTSHYRPHGGGRSLISRHVVVVVVDVWWRWCADRSTWDAERGCLHWWTVCDAVHLTVLSSTLPLQSVTAMSCCGLCVEYKESKDLARLRIFSISRYINVHITLQRVQHVMKKWWRDVNGLGLELYLCLY